MRVRTVRVELLEVAGRGALDRSERLKKSERDELAGNLHLLLLLDLLLVLRCAALLTH